MVSVFLAFGLCVMFCVFLVQITYRCGFLNKEDKTEIGKSDYFIGKAYIITTTLQVPADVLSSAEYCGFLPETIPAKLPYGEQFQYSKELMYGKCFGIQGRALLPLNISSVSNITMAELSLVCTHRAVMKIIAEDSSMMDSDWALIMENDAALNPNVNASLARSYVLRAITAARRESALQGFIYLGICRGSCRSKISSPTDSYQIGKNCYGSCTHAYAITKFTATNLFETLYTNDFLAHPDRHLVFKAPVTIPLGPHIDSAYKTFFQVNRKAYGTLKSFVAGFNFESPDEPTHTGLLYQRNRSVSVKTKGTTLLSDSFLPQTCFIMLATGSSTVQLLAQYNALVGFCLSRGMHPLQCASFVQSDRNKSIFDTFRKQFRIRIVECIANGRTVNEHDLTVDVWRKVSETSFGTTFRGAFRSPRFFHAQAKSWMSQLLSAYSPYHRHSNSPSVRRIALPGSSCAATASEEVCILAHSEMLISSSNSNALDPLSSVWPYVSSRFRERKIPVAISVVFDGNVQKSDYSYLNRFWNDSSLCLASELRWVDGIDENIDRDMRTIRLLQGCRAIVLPTKSSVGWWGAYLSSANEVLVSKNYKHILPAWTVLPSIT